MMLDFAILGSGVSGGRLAARLTQEGAKCVLIEAGRKFTSDNFPQNEIDYSAQLFWGGGVELSQDGYLGFLRGKAVGGTSIVNQALVDRFDEIAWTDWHERTGVSFFNSSEMAPYYQRVEDSLSIQTIPESLRNRNAKIFQKGFEDLNYHWTQVRRAQKNCALEKGSDCIACLGGCRRNSKQSTLVTSILPALEQGLKLETEFEVLGLEDKGNFVRVFGDQRGQKREIQARKVFLASGSVGSTTILQRSLFQKKPRFLGKGFSCHPQYMSFGLFSEPVDAHRGAFQALKSEDSKMRRSGYKLENVFAPPIGTAMLIPGFGHSHLEWMRKYRYLASMETCIRDEPNGTIKRSRSGKIILNKPITSHDRKKINESALLIQELLLAAGAKKVIRGRQGFGLHLMGGCRIGTNPKKSVVNPEFQLHVSKNVYLADSSIFPSAPGINPSLTIMALTEKAADLILKETR